jgi:hypothetical protein
MQVFLVQSLFISCFVLINTCCSIRPTVAFHPQATFGKQRSRVLRGIVTLPASHDSPEEETPKKLGINIGSMLNPMTEQDVMDIKMEATEMIQDVIAASIDDMEALRKDMQQELQQSNQERIRQNERNTRVAEKQLLSKIDALTDSFLSTTASSRTATKLAARADQAMEGQGLELGSWGIVNGRYVTTGAAMGDSVVGKAKSNRMLVIADTSSDPYAKQLLEPLEKSLQTVLQRDGNDSENKFEMMTYKPTATVPLGSNNADALLLFCTSINDVSTVQNLLSRLLRTALVSNEIVQPPTQVVVLSTLGTARTEKMPYSLQNMMSGGKLTKRRQMEEAVVRYLQLLDGRIDYTICHLGEVKADTNEPFQLLPGDAVEGTAIALDTAVTVLTHAIALQASARNTTFSCTGHLPPCKDGSIDSILDDAFLRLDGPEILRLDLGTYNNEDQLNSLVEYITEWATLFAESYKGLTTPVRCEVLPTNAATAASLLPSSIAQQSSKIRLLFQPTATGKYYVSKEEERESDREGKSLPSAPIRSARLSRDGGIEFTVEVWNTEPLSLRARAKRCNYGPDTMVKELSEETIVSQFKKCIDVWKKDHAK